MNLPLIYSPHSSIRDLFAAFVLARPLRQAAVEAGPEELAFDQRRDFGGSFAAAFAERGDPFAFADSFWRQSFVV